MNRMWDFIYAWALSSPSKETEAYATAIGDPRGKLAALARSVVAWDRGLALMERERSAGPSHTQISQLVENLNTRASIRRSIPTRRSVQNGEPDRLSDLLEEAARAIEFLQNR